jgi:hypothetical protein
MELLLPRLSLSGHAIGQVPAMYRRCTRLVGMVNHHVHLGSPHLVGLPETLIHILRLLDR